MTRKKILLMGLSATATEAGIHAWLSSFAAVRKVDLVREGDPTTPLAVVEMDINDGQAFLIVSRISRYWHAGSVISARLLIH
jgi:hypothetical protein